MGCCGSNDQKSTNKVSKNQPSGQIQSSDVIIQPNKIETKRDYKKGELIGTGAFSEVYQALDNKTGKILAIKTVKLQGEKDQVLWSIFFNIYLIYYQYSQRKYNIKIMYFYMIIIQCIFI